MTYVTFYLEVIATVLYASHRCSYQVPREISYVQICNGWSRSCLMLTSHLEVIEIMSYAYHHHCYQVPKEISSLHFCCVWLRSCRMLSSYLKVIATVTYASHHCSYQVPRKVPSSHLQWVITVVPYAHIPSWGNNDRVIRLTASQFSSSMNVSSSHL